jgi:benzylsuccinate CoA-transferase BbsE subunit
MHRLLENYTALDVTDAKGQLCGRFLADLGMRVIKVESPAGDPLRRHGPFHRFSDGSTLSLEFAHLNANKESLIINLETESGRLQFCQQVANADVVIESQAPGYLDSLGIGYPDLVTINPTAT